MSATAGRGWVAGERALSHLVSPTYFVWGAVNREENVGITISL